MSKVKKFVGADSDWATLSFSGYFESNPIFFNVVKYWTLTQSLLFNNKNEAIELVCESLSLEAKIRAVLTGYSVVMVTH